MVLSTDGFQEMNLFDLILFQWLNSWAFWQPWADALIVFRAVFLGYWMLAALLAFGVATLAPLSTIFPSFRPFRLRNWEMIATALVGAMIARFGIAELIRFLYDRPRPFDLPAEAFAEAGGRVNQLIFRDSGGSFPSGHAVFYFAIAAVVSRYYPKASILFFLAAFNLSVARIQAGIHWPSDIVGGAIIGVAVWKPKPAA